MTPTFQDFLASCQNRCAQSLPLMMGGPSSEYLSPDSSSLEKIFEASNYSLSNPGKRIRPVLVYAAAAALGRPIDTPGLDHAACAVEMIHTYSLVHDDLPAMDNDDLRRGMPSCHKAYDEATAILAGDGLQARAFELICESPDPGASQKLKMIKILAAAAGPRGMVGGQMIDIASLGREVNLKELTDMHVCKTGALIRVALSLGAIVVGARQHHLQALDEYGRHIGLAFQVVDDILDVEGSDESLGKTAGKDAEANKPTYVKLLGLEGAKVEAARLLEASLEALVGFGESADRLRQIAEYIVNRKN